MRCNEERTEANTTIRVDEENDFFINDGDQEVLIFSDEIDDFIDKIKKLRDAKRQGGI